MNFNKPVSKIKSCTCAAYDYPHRLDSGKCRTLYNNTDISNDYKSETTRDFERSEAQAYNRELDILNNGRVK